MTLPHGRGKQSFRVFTKALNAEIKNILSAIQNDGEEYTQADVFRFTEVLVKEYEAELRAQELDVELWGDRATDLQLKKVDELTAEYNLETGGKFEDEPEGEEVENEIDVTQDTIEGGKLFGIDIITPENKPAIRAGGKPRKRVLLTLAELYEYVSKVPYVLAIQIIERYDGGKNYRVWVDKRKDQYTRKTSKSAS